jgi:hypothetical protein
MKPPLLFFPIPSSSFPLLSSLLYLNYIRHVVLLADVCPVCRTTDREEDFMTETGNWKLLIATPDEAEVYLLKSRLESEGINCRIEELSRYPDKSHVGRSREFRAYVSVNEFESSQQVLEEDELDEEGL